MITREDLQRLRDTVQLDPPPSLTLALEPKPAFSFAALFLSGCVLSVPTGCSVRELLCGHCHIEPRYVDEVITTVFLDASPVDDLDRAFIHEGSTLALSAALPGLVGAAMRRDGPSWLRAAITYQEKDLHPARGKGFIVLKLFNRIMCDLGSAFLQQGVYVRTDALASILAKMPEEFWSQRRPCELNGERSAPRTLIACLGPVPRWVYFSLSVSLEP